jgi:hypothetical protein
LSLRFEQPIKARSCSGPQVPSMRSGLDLGRFLRQGLH